MTPSSTSGTQAGMRTGVQRVWDTVRDAFHDPSTRVYSITQGTIWFLIAASVALFMVEIALQQSWAEDGVVSTIDTVVLWFFGFEFLLRVATFRPPALDYFHQTIPTRMRSHIVGRLQFCARPMMIVDLLTVMALVPEFRALRALRLLRLVRTGKLFPYSNLFQAVGRSFAENHLLYAVVLSLFGSMVLVGGTTIYLAEARDNPDISTLGDGLWWAVVTLTTVGFGDITPNTGVGRIVGGILMLGGMFTLALFAGVVGTTMINSVARLREEQLRMVTTIGHTVVCGYDASSRMLLKALIRESDPNAELIIFSGGERPAEIPARFRWVPGDPTKESELDKVDLVGAAAAIIVGGRDVLPHMADARTLLTIFTMRAYLARQESYSKRVRPLHIVSEILEPENVSHARSAGSDEVIESARLGFSMIAHAAVAPGTSAILTLVASRDGHSLHACQAGALGAENLTFGALAQSLRADHGALALGIQNVATGEDELNPADSTVVSAEDHIIYLADRALEV